MHDQRLSASIEFRVARLQKRLSQTEVARAIGIRKQTLSDFECGRINLTIEQYGHYTDVLASMESKAPTYV